MGKQPTKALPTSGECQQKSSPRCPTTCLYRVKKAQWLLVIPSYPLSKKRNQSGFIVEIGNTSRIPEEYHPMLLRQKVPILFTETRPSDTSDAHGSHLRSKVENGRSTDPRSDFETNMDGGKKTFLWTVKKTRGVLQILETQPGELMKMKMMLIPTFVLPIEFHHRLVPPQPWHPVRYTRPKASLYQSRPGEGFPVKSTPYPIHCSGWSRGTPITWGVPWPRLWRQEVIS